MSEPERKKLKLEDVAEFIKEKDKNPQNITHPKLEDIGEHRCVVLHTHSDEDQLAFIKPGPFSEAEKKLCNFILRVDDEDSFPRYLMIDLITMASYSEKNNKESIIRDMKNFVTAAKFCFRVNEVKGNGKVETPWTLEEYIELLKQVAMDAKEGKWFAASDTELINRYSMQQGTLNICMNTETD